MKLIVLKCLDAGKRAVDIRRALGVPPTTVRTVCGNVDKIGASVQSVIPLSASRTSHTKSSLMEQMQKLLAT